MRPQLRSTDRAEKVAEITSWLKSHPVSSVSRTSCELQVLDGAIVEKIEEAVEKVTHISSPSSTAAWYPAESSVLSELTRPPVLPFVFQLKKNNKKVRVTVKPHLLFRVSASSS